VTKLKRNLYECRKYEFNFVIHTRNLVPYYCTISYFIDLHYCNYILAIKRLNIVKIILDTTYVLPVEPRKLVTTVNKRNRPHKVTSKALEKIVNTWKSG